MDNPKIEIPALRADDTTQLSVKPVGDRGGVLIVDDTPSKLVALGAIVSGMGLEIVTANSGEQALRQLLKRDFAVILLDVNMPTMGGFETATLIRSRPRSAHTPIIFVTAGAYSDAERISGYTLGAVDYIYAPIIPEILRAKVQVFVNLFDLQRQVLLHNEHLESLVAQRTAALTEEIAERKRAEEKVKRLNRIYAVLSGINATIVRIHDRQELLTEACHIAVEHGQFRTAWIGLLDPNGEDVTPVAKAGFEEGYLDQIRLTAQDDVPDSFPLVARALREKAPVVCNDIGADPLMARWREAALQRGYRSLVVFPLHMGGKMAGLLLLYASEKDFFDAEEMRLLTEIAGGISFALEYIEKESRLNYLAYYDVLTGLPSRTLFQDRLDQALTYANRHESMLAVLLIDLDDFKTINDSLGHHTGDQLLKQLATRLTGSLREGDTVARLGGDEFVVILDNVASEEDASVVTQKILKLGIEPFTIDSHELFVTCSIGIASYPKDGEDAETLLKNADAALYRAKDQGRNNAQFCSAEMNAKALQRLTLENNLRNALKRQEFLLHYQARVDLHSGEITGMEALVRWQHPKQGLIPPGRFIPVAEDSGLIVPLGAWVLRTACAQNKAWQAAGLKPVCVAVNLSARQFRQQDLVELVTRILQETGLDAVYLELELTESMMMQNVEATIATLTRLKAIGVKFSIDDFGTGYSSLSYLKRFPIDSLKIDQSFVRDLSTDPNDAAITKTIISMAHDLGLRVIAEGVETQEQETFLRLHHCDEMQGYFFSKPVPAKEFEVLLSKGQVK